jgi:Ca-activated chloride channel family protein
MFKSRLAVLWVVPVFLGIYLIWTLIKGRRQGADRSGLEALFPKRKAWKRHVAVVAAVATIASLTLAWAKPFGYVDIPRERATVFLVIDVSLSMEAADVKPTRLKAAQEAAKQFVNELPPGFNVSLITFAALPTTVVQPTTDRGAITRAIDRITLAQSTAIGDAIYAALDGLVLIPPDPDHPDEPPPAAIVLLSDGDSNTGRLSTTAAMDAKTLQVPIFTIAFGTPWGYILDERNRQMPVEVKTEELREIARLSGGKAYTADTLDKLNEVYQGISRSIGYEKIQDEITERFVGAGVLLGIISLLGVMSLAARWP